mmetsp:Transcript_22679/g.69281  ORF Transcript_22679/g.69281 Transcript_22679/m.69281 type:complete len:131 (+) Transcript_22679:1372-1764(+)
MCAIKPELLTRRLSHQLPDTGDVAASPQLRAAQYTLHLFLILDVHTVLPIWPPSLPAGLLLARYPVTPTCWTVWRRLAFRRVYRACFLVAFVSLPSLSAPNVTYCLGVTCSAGLLMETDFCGTPASASCE